MDVDSKSPGFLDFLVGGGEMGTLIGSKDWSDTPLGAVEGWPQSLKTSIALILSSQHPMWVGWGRENTFLYNDAYIPVLGVAKHPWALGRPAAEVWAEIWNICGPLSDKVYQQGEATIADDVRLFMRRGGGSLEETFYSFSYSPIRDESGRVGGLFCPSTDVTGKNLNARRLGTLAELAAKALVEKSTAAACATAAGILARNPDDIPFALLYMSDAEGKQAILEQTTGLSGSSSLICPPALPLEGEDAAGTRWRLAEVVSTSEARVVPVNHLDLPPGPAGQPVREAIVLPVSARGYTRPIGALVAGINPTRRLDAEYHTFFTLVAAQIATAVSNARTYDEERKRAEALAEIDHAKTVFFSNVSHEFRTPLTLILGPTEELLSGALGATTELQRAHLETLRNNAVRLQKLVNTLLDYARIEAGRIEASYEPVDIGLLTRGLASTFCSAMHRAGLLYIVNCPSSEEPVYIDREMWEKIVLNLLSNALKFTFEGVIEVSLTSFRDRVALAVRDTGVGIAAKELPHLFDRFHRVHGSRARTQEGSGIGLALVQELVKLHGGSLEVKSAVGAGTNFTIVIPKGSAHLPKERVSGPRALSSTALGAAPFIEEALRWLPDAGAVETLSLPVGASSFTEAPRAVPPSAQRILVADDNLEMRSYLKRLLEAHWNITAVADGGEALEAARAQQPDLVLSDVMLPGLDGFELLRRLREDDRTHTIPVILLSARAGEESYIEGMNAGADDYIVKPFGARELVARVKALLEVTRVRRESERRVSSILESITDGFQVIDADWRLTYMNSEAKRTLVHNGIDPEWAIGKHFWDEVLPQGKDSEIATALRRAMTERVAVAVESYYPPWDRWYYNRVYPLPEGGLANYFQDISERKAAEKANARLAAIVESSADAIVSKDLNGIITSWNGGAARLFGYTEEEALHQPVSMLIPPDRLDEEPHILERIRRGERIEHYETVRRRKDGTAVEISLSISPIVDAQGRIVGASKIGRDITGRKLAERKLRESEERFRNMADSSPIMIWTTDAAGRFTFLNRAYLEYFDISPDDAAAFDWSEVVHPDDRDGFVAAFRKALQTGQTFHQRARLRRRDGQWRWLESRGAPILDASGQLSAYIGSSPDISEIYESQQALKELGQRKDEFLANMSHEIRSPLTGIMGFADILLSRLTDAEDIECLHTIKESGDYLIEIVNDILDLSKIEAGKLVLNIEAVSVHSVFAEVQSLMDVRARQKKLSLSLRYQGTLPENIQTDRTRLRQILINLVSNAIKFTERGRVEIVARALDGLLQIEVIDTGIGIAPEHQEILFMPFTQADTTSTRQYGGTGLGLTITRRLVEMLAGNISFESELGKGSIFRVTIPALTASAGVKAILRPRLAVPLADPPPLRNRHILVVDDREEICYLVSRYISEAGGRSATAGDGEDAIQAVEAAAAADPFDAMILDIHMPGMDGYEVARALRAKGFLLPIIALTAGAMVGDREKCLQAGCDDYLTKPIDRRKLVQLVAQQTQKLGRRHGRDGAPLRVLVVDDSHNACIFLSGFLERRGHEVRCAYDGAAALSMAQDFRPDVVLLDIRLPDMNGYELLLRLKKLDGIDGASFIALSGYYDADMPEAMQFDHFIEKPLDTAHLDSLLRAMGN